MSAATLAANRRLAELLGWKNITDAGGTLLGMPPWAIPNARGQAQVPNWAGDWQEAGKLIAQHNVHLVTGCWSTSACAAGYTPNMQPHDKHNTPDEATRAAVVQAVITKLEAK